MHRGQSAYYFERLYITCHCPTSGKDALGVPTRTAGVRSLMGVGWVKIPRFPHPVCTHSQAVITCANNRSIKQFCVNRSIFGGL